MSFSYEDGTKYLFTRPSDDKFIEGLKEFYAKRPVEEQEAENERAVKDCKLSSHSENIGRDAASPIMHYPNIITVADASSLPEGSKNISQRSVLHEVSSESNLNQYIEEPTISEPSSVDANDEMVVGIPESHLACKICGGYAKGTNYGVLTCEGCRTFFIQYIHMKEDLKCRRNNNCVIDKFITKKCAKCKIEKCLMMGMDHNQRKTKKKSTCSKNVRTMSSGNQVFFRRYAGKDVKLLCYSRGNCNLLEKFTKCQKCRMRKCLEVGMNRNAHVQKQNNQKEAKLRNEQVIESKFIKEVNKVVEIFKLSCTYKEEVIENFAKINFDLTLFNDPLIDRLNAWQAYAPIIDFENRQSGLFANHLPFIKTFEISDKTILFKRSSFLMFILRNITKFNSDGFMLSSKGSIPFQTLETVYGDQTIINKIVLVSSEFQSMQLTHQELSLFTAFIFLRPFSKEAQDWKMFKGFSTLKAVRNYYRSLLYQLLKKRENSMKMVTGLAKMNSKLYEINKLHNETISFLQLNSQFMNLPSSLCEVYDIKKQERNLNQLDGNTAYNAAKTNSFEESEEIVIANKPEAQNMEWDSLDLDDIEFDSAEYDLSDENEEIQLDKYLHSDEGDIEFENALCAAEQENKDLDSIS
ncbi:hypothetical protein GCK72_007724 [Caenorhabditis remanei]|uniref:Nuclear receptor domain-containing protein n=1 Tax=Caenorhabditis remanei TaxID=31234 RepID=A0A6A5HJU1_CAERE|nr:hypothetical protein GCK72_007724 [Caenorhabditis remanei]KAF1767765.1 hypothetical protein GCK72_007724 [Caenorhabditis remanei]